MKKGTIKLTHHRHAIVKKSKPMTGLNHSTKIVGPKAKGR